MSQSVLDEIESILRKTFNPIHLKVKDDSAGHRGHAGAMQAGAKKGGTHFKVEIVADVFEGKSLLERHRAVKEALKEFFGEQIHALQLKAMNPSEWENIKK